MRTAEEWLAACMCCMYVPHWVIGLMEELHGAPAKHLGWVWEREKVEVIAFGSVRGCLPGQTQRAEIYECGEGAWEQIMLS